MKDHNTRFKAIGYEFVPENSTANYSEYVRSTEDSYKMIGIKFSGEGMSVIVHEKIRGKNGEFKELDVSEIDKFEFDAIYTLLEETDFVKSIRFNDTIKKYILGKGAFEEDEQN